MNETKEMDELKREREGKLNGGGMKGGNGQKRRGKEREDERKGELKSEIC